MTQHPSENQLINYILHTLTDAEREALDHHLTGCADCRTRLDDQETFQRRIFNGLSTDLRRVWPSTQMNFAAIAPRVQRKRRLMMFANKSNQLVYGVATMALLVAIGVGLYFFLSNLSQPTPTTRPEVESPTVVPAVASQPTATPTTKVSQPTSTPTIEVSRPTATPTTVVSQSSASPVEFVWSIKNDSNPLSHSSDVAVDRQGNLYVVDGFNHRIQKFDRNGQFLTMWGSQGDDDGQFNFMAWPGYADGSVAVDEQGHVYVGDVANARIQKFDNNGQFLATWGSRGFADGQFSAPTGVAVDRQGNVYVVDAYRKDIQKFDSNGRFLATWGGPGPEEGQLDGPTRLAVDEEGNVYVTDDGTNQIHKFDGNGQFLVNWGGSGTGDGEFLGIIGITIDGQGNIYVADLDNHRIQKLDSQGRFLAAWGSYGSGEGQFNDLRGLAVDEEGNVYVADYGDNRIQKFRQP